MPFCKNSALFKDGVNEQKCLDSKFDQNDEKVTIEKLGATMFASTQNFIIHRLIFKKEFYLLLKVLKSPETTITQIN